MCQAIGADAPAAKRFPEILRRLRQRHPDAHCELDYETPLQLLVATILSAQCTDVRVNQVTPELFDRFPDAESLAAAPREEIEAIIRPTGFFRQKARYIQESAHKLLLEHDGEMPDSLKTLTKLPGVARKTGNVVLGEVYGIAEGVTVDTHVRRLSNRLGFTSHEDPNKIEKDLMKLVPKSSWIEISHLLIFHGRRVCDARNPACENCTLAALCPSAFTF